MSSLLFKLLVGKGGGGPAINWGSRKMGLGLGQITYYDNSFAFADIAKHGSIITTAFDPYTAFDSLRNPTTDSLLIITSAKLKNGVYKLSFTGKCDTLAVGGADIAISSISYNAGTNRTTADVTCSNEATSSNRWVSLTGSHSSNVAATNTGVTNIKLMRPGYTTEIFTSEFLSAMSASKILRGMDWALTNVNDSVAWADRQTPLAQGTHPTRGASWEELILLCNQTGNDLWINIPAQASDDYILKLAQLVKYGSDGTSPYTSVQGAPVYPPLAPALNVYIEYGNEVWNSGPGFWCFVWAKALGNTYKSDTTHPIAYDGVVVDQYDALRRWVAYRSSFISLTMRTVFGDAAMMSKVRPILSCQAGNGQDYLRTGLVWAEGFYSAVRGTAPINPTIRKITDLWYGAGGAAYIDSINNAPQDTAPASLNDYFNAIPVPEFAERIRIDALFAKSRGLKLVTYEGGPEPGGSYLGGGASSPGAVSAAVNMDPRMTSVIEQSQATFDSFGGDEFVYYLYSGAGNAWSFTNNLVTPVVSDTDTPKMLGLAASAAKDRSAATFGVPVAGLSNLKGSTIAVLGSNADVAYQSGACYLLSSTAAYILIAVLCPVAQQRRLALELMQTWSDPIEVLVNGVSAGTISPTLEAGDTVRVTPYVVASFNIGVNVVWLRKPVSVGQTHVRGISLTTNNFKTVLVNLTNGVNLDIADNQGVITISRE